MCVCNLSCCEQEEAGGGKTARRYFSAGIGCLFSTRMFLSCGIGWVIEIIVVVEFLTVNMIINVLSPRPIVLHSKSLLLTNLERCVFSRSGLHM